MIGATTTMADLIASADLAAGIPIIRETALVIAGGSSWPHWLAGTATEGMRWVDDAFACRGEVSDLTQALALTGRGLLSLLAGRIAAADADLSAAVEIFRSRDDVDDGPRLFIFRRDGPPRR